MKIIKNDVIILDKEYKMVYDYIFSIITKENEIWLNDINNYVEYNYNDEFFMKWNYFINNSLSMRGFYTTDFIRFQKDAIIKYYKIVIPILILITLYLLIILPSMGIMAIFVFPIFLIFGYLDSKNIKVQSNRSIYEYKKIMALKKFLKDFTIINERGPEYVEILEDYIVYAGYV